MIVLHIILLVFCVEATAEIITSSKLTDGWRRSWKLWTYPDEPNEASLLQKFRVFVDALVSCGYCTSVWTAAFFALFAPEVLSNLFSNWLVMTFSLHRMSSWLHVVYELVRKGRVISIELLKNEEDDDGIS